MLNDKLTPLWKQFLSEFPGAGHTDVSWEANIHSTMDHYGANEAGAMRLMLNWAMEARDRLRSHSLTELIEDPLNFACVYESPKVYARMVGWHQVARERLQRLSDELK